MNAETKLALLLMALFGAGLVLVAVGLGAPSRPAAFAVGLIVCVASVSLLREGRR
jgi:hypothetical protein